MVTLLRALHGCDNPCGTMREILQARAFSAFLRAATHRYVWGVLSFAMGLVSALALVGLGGEEVLGWWAGALRSAFGLGAVLFAALLIVGGLVVLSGAPFRSARRAWLQLLFAEVGFLAFLGFAHALSPGAEAYRTARAGDGGGAVGWVLAELLWRALGVGGATPAPTLGHALALLIWLLLFLFSALSAAAPWLVRSSAGEQRRARSSVSSASTAWVASEGQPVAAPSLSAVPRAPKPTVAAAPSSAPKPAVHTDGDPVIVSADSAAAREKPARAYARPETLPPLSLLKLVKERRGSDEEARRQAQIIETTLAHFGLAARVVEIRRGPSVTQFGVEPGFVERGAQAHRDKALQKLRAAVVEAFTEAITLEASVDRTVALLSVPAALVNAREAGFRNVLRALLSEHNFSLSVEESEARGARIVFELGADSERKLKIRALQLTNLHRGLVNALAENLVRFDNLDASDMLTERLTVRVPMAIAEAIELRRHFGRALAELGLVGEVNIARRGLVVEWQKQTQKVRVSAIAALQDDLALALAAPSIRIEAPIPGRGLIGIEVPNASANVVDLRSVMESEAFRKLAERSPLALALGRDVSGTPICADLARMPHLLIAGTTGSGKSVAISAMITCLVMNNRPEDLRLVMIDPKLVELSRFAGLPHLIGKPESDLERIPAVLRWVAREMDARYKQFAALGARNLRDYNALMARRKQATMPYIVVFIDELADLMLQSPIETEKTLCRIAQMARATGIHLVVATQRPSVDVVTGLIKANFPARIAFAVASSVDSRVILDQTGAETLVGRGDMLFLNPELGAPIRLQGCFVSDAEVEGVVQWWRRAVDAEGVAQEGAPAAESSPWESLVEEVAAERRRGGRADEGESASDDAELLQRAMEIVRTTSNVSTSLLQRRLRIGYPRAARLMEELQAMGYVSNRGRETNPR